jgi:tetratricopeptide (TPR) repeat protein
MTHAVSSNDLDLRIAGYLKEAQEARIPDSTADAYIKAAKLQVKKGDMGAAARSLDLAYANSDRLETACKIARVRLKIQPNALPQELLIATQSEEEERRNNKSHGQKIRHLLPFHTGKLCHLAKTYLKANHQEKAKELIGIATECLGGQTWEYCSDLIKLARVQIKAGMNDDAAFNLEKAVKTLSSTGAAPESLATMWISIARVFVSINRERAIELIHSALNTKPHFDELCSIVRLQISLGLANDASATLELILEKVSTWSEPSRKIKEWCSLGTMFIPIDLAKTRQIMRLAQDELPQLELETPDDWLPSAQGKTDTEWRNEIKGLLHNLMTAVVIAEQKGHG